MPLSRPLVIALAAGACTAAAALQPIAAPPPRLEQPPVYDLLIRGGRIVDGTGSPWYRGDVAIRGDRSLGRGE